MLVRYSCSSLFLRKHQVPDTIYYIPNFITDDEHEDLMFRIDHAPKPKWRKLSNRRLQNWGGFPHPKVTAGEPLPIVSMLLVV
jgi:alkylated DNA repair protein alkB family protein 6